MKIFFGKVKGPAVFTILGGEVRHAILKMFGVAGMNWFVGIILTERKV